MRQRRHRTTARKRSGVEDGNEALTIVESRRQGQLSPAERSRSRLSPDARLARYSWRPHARPGATDAGGSYVAESEKAGHSEWPQAEVRTTGSGPGEIMPCIRCGKITVKLCTCSIDDAKEALSAWSEAELKQAINTFKAVLDTKQKRP